MDMVDKLVMLAEARGWDQGEVESRAGLARGRISKWKADQGEPSAKQALRLARLFQVPVEFLVDDEQNEPPSSAAKVALADDERAIIDLYHDLDLDKKEAVKRLATPLATGQAWNPGAVRDLTASETARQRERSKGAPSPAPGPIPLKDLLIGQRNHLPSEEAEEPPKKAPRRKREG
jgi:transcriptional regulator with XRE-family HTH domain